MLKVLSYPAALVHRIVKALIELVGSIVFLPLFLFVNLLTRVESWKVLEGDLTSPKHQMILALPKLLICLLNFGSYLLAPLSPIYIAQTHKIAYAGRDAILNYRQKEHIVPEKKIIILGIIFLMITFVQFHVLRFLFSWRIPGLTLKR